MSVELVNGHVLLPNGADWSTRPRRTRRWQSGISTAVTGRESRQALRQEPRLSIEVQICGAATIVAQQMLDDRIRAAAKLGLACLPHHGRGGNLTADADAGANEVTVSDAWPWQAGDYFFAGDENGSDAIIVTAAVLAAGIWTLTLEDVLTFDHLAGAFAWPLLFGEFSASKMPALTPRFGPVRVTVSELTSARSAQLGELVPVAGDGIGHMIVGDTFEVA